MHSKPRWRYYQSDRQRPKRLQIFSKHAVKYGLLVPLIVFGVYFLVSSIDDTGGSDVQPMPEVRNQSSEIKDQNAEDFFSKEEIPALIDIGRFVNLTGDFDGDGDVDILVRDHDKRISAYPFVSRDRGFSKRSCVRFNYVDLVDWFDVKDLNGDGVSDLISKSQTQDVLKVFVSQR